jgi:aminopeptidase N
MAAVVAVISLIGAATAGGAIPTPVDAPGAATVPLPRSARDWPDVHSFADTEAFVTRHIDLDLEVDFERRELRGTATLDVERLDPRATELVLDMRDLRITTVETAAGREARFTPATFDLGPRHEILGSALRIAMPLDARRVRIRYASSPQASGLQWLEPAQTAGKRQPFLYSQAQALHARSFVPLQDTPRVRATYTATLRVPRGLTAVMAAASEAQAGSSATIGDALGPPRAGGAADAATTTFRFYMPQPVPSYLIALAVGDLRFKATGPRTGVWAEPEVLEAAAWEFADMDAMLRKAEALYGAYRWDRYDVLVLPPSFPFGGMENPRLTFMTPTVIAGDRSLVGVLAHELAHSWSGNLVTNATWRDGWLNEGFTTYVERRLMEAIYGPERAAMEWGIGEFDLRTALDDLGPAEAWRGALAPDLSARVSEEGSSVAYEKGALFLRQLEDRFGRETLDGFLKRWFEQHAFTSVTTPEFVDYLRRELLDRYPGRVDEGFVKRWIEGEGVPEDAVFVRSDAFARVDRARLAWERGDVPTSALDVGSWSALEWLHFINGITRPQPRARLAELDARFRLTETGNAELAHAWFRLAIASGYEAAFPALERYLLRVGRIKLVRPLYKDLQKTPAGSEFAQRVYAVARPGYHPITQRALDKVMSGRDFPEVD